MKASLLFLFSLLIAISSFSQESDSTTATKADNSPIIGIGVSTIGFFGDLNDKNYGTPFGSNPAFNINLIQPITDELSVKFDLMLGNVRDEERSLERNLNFETKLTGASVLLEYNFSNFLPEKRFITPSITAGISVIEFNTKMDLLDRNREPYNYWTDGTIRNIPENSSEADQAVIINRDYSFETDVRDAGINNSTTYEERTFAVPVGLGVTMHLNDQVDFRFQSTLYLTFTDYIDGITRTTSKELVGNKNANANNDHFLVSGVSVSYNFQKVKGIEQELIEKREEDFDFLNSGNSEDYDGDGVIDLIDICPSTPDGVEVDSVGCPVDSDGDGLADYKDEEINSEYPEFANEKGVELTDEMIYRSYLMYMDSTLELAEVIEREFTGSRGNKKVAKYRVKLGQYGIGDTPLDMSTLIILPDLATVDQDEKTLYTVGKYNTLPQATRRKQELEAKGYGDAVVVERNRKGKYVPVADASAAAIEAEPITKPINSNQVEEVNQDPNEIVFRVQLGAFKVKPSNDAYKEIPSLFVIESGGYYRYMSGSFKTFEEAAKHKVKMNVSGYKDAFVVAYKGGKKVSLKSVGVVPIQSDPVIGQ